MRRHALSLFLSACAALILTRPAHAQIAATGAIEGQVLTQDSARPLPARVWLVGAVRPSPPNARGSFRFERLKPGRYHLRATYLGYAPADTVVSIASGARLRIILHLPATPVRLADMTIREASKPPAPPPPPPPPQRKPVVNCGLLLVVSAKVMLCTSPQALPRTTVVRSKEFLGPNSLIRQSAQRAIAQSALIPERELQLNDRTWMIAARDPSRPVGLGIVRIEIEETGAHNTIVRVALTSAVFVSEQQQRDRAQAYLSRVDRILKAAR